MLIKTNQNEIKVSSKQFGVNGVSLSVTRRLDVLDEQHFVDETLKLASAFLQHFKKMVNTCLSVQIMLRHKIFTNGRVPMFTDALM